MATRLNCLPECGQPTSATFAHAPGCQAGECRWTEDSNGVFETACGEAFQCEADGPQENGFKFCVYCGGRLVTVPYERRP